MYLFKAEKKTHEKWSSYGYQEELKKVLDQRERLISSPPQNQ